MKSAKEFREELDALCFTWNGESLLGDDAIELIEARDSEHAAALAKAEERCRVLETALKECKQEFRMLDKVDINTTHWGNMVDMISAALEGK